MDLEDINDDISTIIDAMDRIKRTKKDEFTAEERNAIKIVANILSQRSSYKYNEIDSQYFQYIVINQSGITTESVHEARKILHLFHKYNTVSILDQQKLGDTDPLDRVRNTLKIIQSQIYDITLSDQADHSTGLRSSDLSEVYNI